MKEVKSKKVHQEKINLTPFKVKSKERIERRTSIYLFISSFCLLISYKVSMKSKNHKRV